MNIDCYTLASRFVGVEEVPGSGSNPQILAWLRLDNKWPNDDAIPYCSAFANWIAWILRCPRSKNLRARSWLNVGTPIDIENARPENDVVILRQKITDPGPDIIEHPGHVTFFAGMDGSRILGLGANQHDSVNITLFDRTLILGVRRLA